MTKMYFQYMQIMHREWWWIFYNFMGDYSMCVPYRQWLHENMKRYKKKKQSSTEQKIKTMQLCVLGTPMKEEITIVAE